MDIYKAAIIVTITFTWDIPYIFHLDSNMENYSSIYSLTSTGFYMLHAILTRHSDMPYLITNLDCALNHRSIT